MPPPPNRTLRWAVGCLCAAWLVGVASAVHISTWPAPPALMVFGASKVWRGATAGFRAVLRASDSRMPLTQVPLYAWLQDADGRAGSVVKATTDDAAAWTLSVPQFEHDAVWLVVRHPDPGGNTPAPDGGASAPSVDTKIRVNLVNGPPDAPLPLAPLNRFAPVVSRRAPDIDLALVPAGGHFTVGLANPGVGWLQRNGQPFRHAHVRSNALHLDTLTDDDGLFDFTYTPPLHPEPLRFVVDDDKGTGRDPAWIDALPRAQVTQFQMLVPTRCFAQADPLPLHIDALPLRDPLAVDLWLGDLLLGTTSLKVQQRSFDVSLGIKAALPSGFLTVAAFRHVLDQAATTSATRPMGTSAEHPVATLAAGHSTDPTPDPWLRHHAGATSERAATFALARVQSGHGATPLMYDETDAVYSAFEQRRHTLRGRIYTVMGGLMGLSVAVICVAAWQMRRQLRRDVGDALLDVPAEALVDADAVRQMTRMANRLYLVLAVGALVLACYGLLAVVGRLRWQ